jgi:hypothetical protein
MYETLWAEPKDVAPKTYELLYLKQEIVGKWWRERSILHNS